MTAPLLTAPIRERLMANYRENECALGERDHWPVVKLFCPYSNATWLLTELDPADGDIAFGLCDLGVGFPELGSVRISEMAALRIGAAPAIERDRHWQAQGPISAYARLAAEEGYILDRLPEHLRQGGTA